jgi:hypothetical protein
VEAPTDLETGEAGAGANVEGAAGGGNPATEDVNIAAGSGCNTAGEEDGITALDCGGIGSRLDVAEVIFETVLISIFSLRQRSESASDRLSARDADPFRKEQPHIRGTGRV